MRTLFFARSSIPCCTYSILCSTVHCNFPVCSLPVRSVNGHHNYWPIVLRSQSRPYPQSNEEEEEDPETQVEDLRVPDNWLVPSKALEESEWLRVTLHKWLDDEYCPEETNVEISRIAAHSYYKSLLEKKTDLGEILLKMALELESISYHESFHGAFSSANAAVNLISQRIEQESPNS
ncbi:Auxin response factor [Quillaja saponaria]|uniref:Auxin response factor n=1 Tax=Quillaja saponaria TaxID=32244 RepID=A0AAD7VEP4_QUISA|nr:Auxin response factor [Quillaja saponaria]